MREARKRATVGGVARYARFVTGMALLARYGMPSGAQAACYGALCHAPPYAAARRLTVVYNVARRAIRCAPAKRWWRQRSTAGDARSGFNDPPPSTGEAEPSPTSPVIQPTTCPTDHPSTDEYTPWLIQTNHMFHAVAGGVPVTAGRGATPPLPRSTPLEARREEGFAREDRLLFQNNRRVLIRRCHYTTPLSPATHIHATHAARNAATPRRGAPLNSSWNDAGARHAYAAFFARRCRSMASPRQVCVCGMRRPVTRQRAARYVGVETLFCCRAHAIGCHAA